MDFTRFFVYDKNRMITSLHRIELDLINSGKNKERVWSKKLFVNLELVVFW